MAAVVLGNAVGLAANAAAAVYYQSAAQASSTSSAAYAANNIKDGEYFSALSQQDVLRGGSSLSVQLFCEVVVLLIIVVAFVVAGVLIAPVCSLSTKLPLLQRRAGRCGYRLWPPLRSFSLHFSSGLCSRQCMPFLFCCDIHRPVAVPIVTHRVAVFTASSSSG
jgi:hypothetical protein